MATIRLRGWKALAALAIFVSLAVFHQIFIRRQLNEQAVQTIKPFLASSIIAGGLVDLNHLDWGNLSEAEKQRLSRTALSTRKIEIRNFTARGFGSDVIVRVEVSVGGQPPPDGRSVRYFRMSHSYLTGWTYHQEVGALSYWSKLW